MNEDRIRSALIKMRDGSNCAQAVLSTYLPLLGISEPFAHKMGAGLGAGVGRKQHICGALNAGAMVISAHVGNELREDAARKNMAMDSVRDLVNMFEEQFGSAQCIEVIGMDISTPQGRQAALDAGKFRDICTQCVKRVCIRLEELLD
jgi:C_GCAxxG_C_C family probable redox protein